MPHLRRSVVRSTSLRLKLPGLCDFRDIEIAELYKTILRQKYVRTLNVPVYDFLLVKGIKARYHLEENRPNLSLLHVVVRCLFQCIDLGLQIPTVCELHHNAERGSGLLKEGLLVASHVAVLNGGQNSYFVDSVVLFFLGKLGKLDLHQRG